MSVLLFQEKARSKERARFRQLQTQSQEPVPHAPSRHAQWHELCAFAGPISVADRLSATSVINTIFIGQSFPSALCAYVI